jgi:hypothetical protein
LVAALGEGLRDRDRLLAFLALVLGLAFLTMVLGLAFLALVLGLAFMALVLGLPFLALVLGLAFPARLLGLAFLALVRVALLAERRRAGFSVVVAGAAAAAIAVRCAGPRPSPMVLANWDRCSE